MSDVEGPGFTIKDKRSSKQSEEEAKAADASQAKDQAPPEEKQAPPEEKQAPPEEKQSPPKDFELNFSTFVLSLTSSAFYHLGDIPDPLTGKKEENLPAVKQTIDILIMLQEKTKNNLDADEAKLMEQLIYELQVKYVAKTPK
ncbi:MAG: DUF1844 domain-containing protein [Nitrospinae bacterium]|nr:DUF1844 domain-containing protein [Nitrospinota bacterium]